MKNLAIKFTCKDSMGLDATGKLNIKYEKDITTNDDRVALSEFIEMCYGLSSVAILEVE